VSTEQEGKVYRDKIAGYNDRTLCESAERLAMTLEMQGKTGLAIMIRELARRLENKGA